jgi:hypothetical protein
MTSLPRSVFRSPNCLLMAPASKKSPSEKQLDRILTAGEVFPDGGLLEIVRDPSGAQRPALLHWDGHHATVAPEIEIDGRYYAPLKIDRGLWQHLRLPSKFGVCGTTAELFDRIRSLITKYSGLTDGYAELLTYFVFASYFVDCSQIGPCVVLHGCAGAEAVGVLRLLGWFCRHPVLLTDIGLRVPERLRPTRLICQPGTSLERYLAPLQLSGFATFRQNCLHELSGATAIYCGEGEPRNPFLDSCLGIPIFPSRVLFSYADEEQESAAIEEIRDQLLGYRLVHFSRVKASNFDVLEFNGSIRGLARALGACIVDAPALQASLVLRLQTHDEAVRLDRISEIPSILLEALLVCCHERRPAVYVQEIADVANDILSRHDETLKLSARQVGGKLKNLGFRTERLDAAGRGLYVLGENCRRVHELAKIYCVPSLQAGLRGCPQCQELFAV